MEITVIKKSKEHAVSNGNNPWFHQTHDNVGYHQLNEIWGKWEGEDSYGYQYSNMSHWEYLVATLDDGTEVQCLTKDFAAAGGAMGYYWAAVEKMVGTKTLPSNWQKIEYRKSRYTSDSYMGNGETARAWTGTIVVARRNTDNTATVFPIPTTIWSKGKSSWIS